MIMENASVVDYTHVRIVCQQQFSHMPTIPPEDRHRHGRKHGPRRDHPILERIYAVTPWKNQAAVCRGLEASTPGVDREHSTLQRWLKRGDGVPPDWLIQVSWLFDVRLAWLQTGEGPMYDEAPTIASYGPVFEALAHRWQRLTATEQSLLWRMAALLPAFAPLWRELVAVLEQARPPTPAERPALPDYLQAASGEAQPEDFPPIDDDHPY